MASINLSQVSTDLTHTGYKMIWGNCLTAIVTWSGTEGFWHQSIVMENLLWLLSGLVLSPFLARGQELLDQPAPGDWWTLWISRKAFSVRIWWVVDQSPSHCLEKAGGWVFGFHCSYVMSPCASLALQAPLFFSCDWMRVGLLINI